MVAFVESGGARMQEGTAALAGYGRIFRETVALTGVVPQISVVSGASAGGGAYSPALTDLIVMTEDAAMFLTGPGVVREALGEEIDAAALGGPRVHDRNGVCHLVERDERARGGARARAARLPAAARRRAAAAGDASMPPSSADPGRGRAGRAAPGLRRPRRAARRWSTAARCSSCARAGRATSSRAFAPDRRAGRSGSSPTSRTTSAACSTPTAREKAARFVGFCDSFGMPLLAVVDTPGFMPGSRQEQAGVIRHGASLVRAFAAARVPKLTVVLRKSYGGAYITMNSRDLGADLVLAWPDAELGIMGARAAVGIVNRRELRAADDPGGRARRARGRVRRRAPARRCGRRAPGSSTRSSSRPTRAPGWRGRCRRCCARARTRAVILAGKRLLITGVITKDSIAFHAAAQAQQEGATILLTSFGRVRRLTERAAARLPEPRRRARARRQQPGGSGAR